MKVKERLIKTEDILKIIEARLEMVTMKYHHATGTGNKIDANVYAETKWQLAELKMQLVDHVLNQD